MDMWMSVLMEPIAIQEECEELVPLMGESYDPYTLTDGYSKHVLYTCS
jgi:hypothetical protein